MNAERRKTLNRLSDELATFRGKIEDTKAELESARDDEQEYFDNMPESMQGGDKGQAAESAIGSLEDALSSVEDALSSLESAESSIQEAMGN